MNVMRLDIEAGRVTAFSDLPWTMLAQEGK